MLSVKVNEFNIAIDLIEGKTIELSMILYSDDIEDLLDIQTKFSQYKPKELFELIAEKLE